MDFSYFHSAVEMRAYVSQPFHLLHLGLAVLLPQQFIPFDCWVVFQHLDKAQCICVPLVWHLGCVHFWAILTAASMNICTPVFM